MESIKARFLDGIKNPPTFNLLWTYVGMVFICGIVTSISARLLFGFLFAELEYPYRILMGSMVALVVVSYFLKRLGFEMRHALCVTVGGILIALPTWITIKLDLSASVYVPMIIVGLVISLPIFTSRLREINAQLQKEKNRP